MTNHTDPRLAARRPTRETIAQRFAEHDDRPPDDAYRHAREQAMTHMTDRDIIYVGGWIATLAVNEMVARGHSIEDATAIVGWTMRHPYNPSGVDWLTQERS